MYPHPYTRIHVTRHQYVYIYTETLHEFFTLCHEKKKTEPLTSIYPSTSIHESFSVSASSMSVPRGVRAQPKYFAGKSGEDVDAWIRHFQAVAIANGWIDDIASVALVYLDGMAFDYMSGVAETRRDTWEKFTVLLRKWFRPRNYEDTVRNQLEMITMSPRETVSEYDQCFSMLVHKLTDLPEDDCRRIFVKGLLGDIAEYVQLQKPGSYEEAVQLALDKEAAVSASHGSGRRMQFESRNEQSTRPRYQPFTPKTRNEDERSQNQAQNQDQGQESKDKSESIESLTEKMRQLTLLIEKQNNRERPGPKTCFNCGKKDILQGIVQSNIKGNVQRNIFKVKSM